MKTITQETLNFKELTEHLKGEKNAYRFVGLLMASYKSGSINSQEYEKLSNFLEWHCIDNNLESKILF